jgi:3-oxoacyl-[acyl-carrier-protein] synthase-3
MHAATPGSARRHQPRRVRLLGTGAALPAECLTSAALDARLGFEAGTVEKRTGVRHRFVERGSAAALGAEAARAALAAAGLGLGDVDCLVAAYGTPDQALPCNAALLHRELGFRDRPVPAFDVGASCLSFLVALDTLSYLIDAGRFERVLVVSSDIASCGLDWERLGASGIFGDGAAATVLGPSACTESALLATAFETHSEGAHLCEVPAGGSRHHPSRVAEPFGALSLFRMDGRALFRFAADRLPPFVDRLMEAAQIPLDEVSLVVPHQASRHALEYLRRRFGLPPERVVDIFAERGNQVAASLPSALDAAVRSGRLRRGDTALLLGTGAGVSFGGAVLCY